MGEEKGSKGWRKVFEVEPQSQFVSLDPVSLLSADSLIEHLTDYRLA